MISKATRTSPLYDEDYVQTDPNDGIRPAVRSNLLWVLFALALACLLATLFVRYRLIFLASSDVGGIESNVIYAIQRYMAGYALYANPEKAPYSITQYSPFYYWIVARFGFLANLSPDNTLGIYRLSRVISLGANLVYASLVFMLSYRLYRNSKVGLIVAISAFVLLPPQTYSRPDSLYNVLVIATLYTTLRSIQSDSKRLQYSWLIGTIGCASLAIATKQSGIILPFILTSYYAIFLRQWQQAAIISLTISLLSALFLLGFMPEHDPVLLYANTVKGISQGLDWSAFKINIIDHFFRTFTVHNMVGLPLSVWLVRQANSSYRWLGWFVLTLFVTSLILSLKSGSALNYFTEYIALTGLVMALWLEHQKVALYRLDNSFAVLLFSAVFWSVLPNAVNFNWPAALRSNALSEEPYLAQKAIADYLTDSLKLKPSDAVFVTYHNYCYLNGLLYKNCLMPQQELVTLMYPTKLFDYASLDKQIRDHNIRFLITQAHETKTSFPGIASDSFRLRRSFPGFDVYESRKFDRLSL